MSATDGRSTGYPKKKVSAAAIVHSRVAVVHQKKEALVMLRLDPVDYSSSVTAANSSVTVD